MSEKIRYSWRRS